MYTNDADEQDRTGSGGGESSFKRFWVRSWPRLKVFFKQIPGGVYLGLGAFAGLAFSILFTTGLFPIIPGEMTKIPVLEGAIATALVTIFASVLIEMNVMGIYIRNLFTKLVAYLRGFFSPKKAQGISNEAEPTPAEKWAARLKMFFLPMFLLNATGTFMLLFFFFFNFLGVFGTPAMVAMLVPVMAGLIMMVASVSWNFEFLDRLCQGIADKKYPQIRGSYLKIGFYAFLGVLAALFMAGVTVVIVPGVLKMIPFFAESGAAFYATWITLSVAIVLTQLIVGISAFLDSLRATDAEVKVAQEHRGFRFYLPNSKGINSVSDFWAYIKLGAKWFAKTILTLDNRFANDAKFNDGEFSNSSLSGVPVLIKALARGLFTGITLSLVFVSLKLLGVEYNILDQLIPHELFITIGIGVVAGVIDTIYAYMSYNVINRKESDGHRSFLTKVAFPLMLGMAAAIFAGLTFGQDFGAIGVAFAATALVVFIVQTIQGRMQKRREENLKGPDSNGSKVAEWLGNLVPEKNSGKLLLGASFIAVLLIANFATSGFASILGGDVGFSAGARLGLSIAIAAATLFAAMIVPKIVVAIKESAWVQKNIIQVRHHEEQLTAGKEAEQKLLINIDSKDITEGMAKGAKACTVNASENSKGMEWFNYQFYAFAKTISFGKFDEGNCYQGLHDRTESLGKYYKAQKMKAD